MLHSWNTRTDDMLMLTTVAKHGLLLACVAAWGLTGCDRSTGTDARSDSDGVRVYALDPDETPDRGGGQAPPIAPPAGGGSASPTSPPAEPAGGQVDDPLGTARIAFAGLSAPVPLAWEREQPGSSMRAVQCRVPGVDGATDARLVVFVGIGGSNDSNISRWVGQFQGDDGQPVTPRVEETMVGDLRITTATLSGNFSGGMGVGDGGPGIMMVQSIVEKPGGEKVFIRLLGPIATVEAARPAFEALLRGIR